MNKILLLILIVLSINIAHAYYSDKDFKAALKDLEDSHLITDSADELSKANKDDLAENLLLRNIDISEKKYGKKNSLSTAVIFKRNLAKLYKKQKKYEQAELLYFSIIDDDESSLLEMKLVGVNNYDLSKDIIDLANIYQLQGKRDKENFFLEKSLKIISSALAGDINTEEEEMLRSLSDDIALTYSVRINFDKQRKITYDQVDYNKAEFLYIRNETVRKGGLNESKSLSNLASFYYIHGKREQAESYYKQSIEATEKSLGKNHLDVAERLDDLAEIYYYDERSEPLLQRSLAIREKELGENHHDIRKSLDHLVLFYFANGKYEQAKPLLQRILMIYEKTDKNNSENKSEQEHIASIRKTLEDWDEFIKKKKQDSQ